MDPYWYRAAMEGNTDELTSYQARLIGVQVTPNQNTVLHVAAQFGKAQFCKEVLGSNSSLLGAKNVRGDAALHVAAREGQSDVVGELIKFAKEPGSFRNTKEMLEATNKDGDTALHDAVRNHHLGVVKLLIDEGPQFTYTTNNAHETPLYLAAERGYFEVLSEILRIRAPAYDGPDGRTALHAAVICDNEESTKALLDWKKDLAKQPDMNGWTPLHYAARFGHVKRVQQLLELQLDTSLAYLTTSEQDDKKTALHVAASKGHVGVMQKLISHRPDCWEMINGKGQNILHVAVENEKMKVIKFILNYPALSSLLNQKDSDGNTPLHLLIAGGHWAYAFKLIDHPRVDEKAFNKQNRNPFDLVPYSNLSIVAKILIKLKMITVGAAIGWRNVISKDKEDSIKKKGAREKYKKEMKKDLKKTGDTHLIVAALIATVTFAAIFTVPGGYENSDGPNKGMAALRREIAFKAFVVTDTLAMVLSTGAVFIYFISNWYIDQHQLEHHQNIAGVLVLEATGAMVVAFITGSYAVLMHSLSLAILVCVIGGVIALVVTGSAYLLFMERVSGPGLGLTERITFGLFH